MNIAVIVAGGVGKRMGQDIPKQFINVNDKPIIIYTLEAFQKHPQIDKIVVVCIEGWHEVLKAYAKQYGISKLSKVVHGGETAQESIRNGVYSLENMNDEDNVIIHDGIRPLVDEEILSNVIVMCDTYGNAVSSLPYNEQLCRTSDGVTTQEYIVRDNIRRVQTPQAYKYRNLFDSYKKAFEDEIGIYGSSYTNTMMIDLGEKLYFSVGSDRNIKLTTNSDIELFKAYRTIKKEES